MLLVRAAECWLSLWLYLQAIPKPIGLQVCNLKDVKVVWDLLFEIETKALLAWDFFSVKLMEPLGTLTIRKSPSAHSTGNFPVRSVN